MSRKFVGLMAVCVAASMASVSQAAQFYFSTSNSYTGAVTNPSVTLDQGQSATLYIWARPSDNDFKLNGVGLDATANTSGVINVTGAQIYNPTWSAGRNTLSRWQGSNVGTITSNGFTGSNSAAVTTGTGLDTYSVEPTTDGYHFPAGAGQGGIHDFLFGQINFTASAPGTTSFFFSVNSNKITSDTISPVPLSFGAGDASVAGNVVGAASSLADATITVNAVPEPASLSLLGLGAMGLIARRRRV